MQFAFARTLRNLRIRRDFLIAKNAKSAQMDAKINRLLVQTAFVPATSELEKQQSRQNTSGDLLFYGIEELKLNPRSRRDLATHQLITPGDARFCGLDLARNNTASFAMNGAFGATENAFMRAKLLNLLVGAWGFEPQTPTVSTPSPVNSDSVIVLRP